MESRLIKILAIDDNPDNLVTIQALVNESFPKVIVLKALSGMHGIELATREDPDVILLDIVMPDMDGYEVCKRLKEDKKLREIPIVFVTAIKGDKESRIKALEYGAEAFLAKPIDESELVAQIRAMVKIKTAHLERHDENIRLAALVTEQTKELKKTYTATLNLLEDLKNENAARRKIEEALRESEEKFREMANLLPQMVFELDINGNITYINEQAYSIFGYNEGELIGLNILDLHLEEERIIVKESIRLILKGIKIENTEYTMIRKDGTVFPSLIYTNLIIKASKTEGLRGILIDITEQKHSEEKIRESEEKFREMANLLPQMVFESDTQGNLTYLNKQAYNICGYNEDETMIGTNLIDYYIPEDRQRAIENIKTRIGGNSIGNSVYTMTRKNLSTFPALVYSNPIFKNYKPVGLRGIIVDITEQKLAEEKIRHIARLYAFLSQINQAMVRTQSLEELFNTICEVAIVSGQFHMAWVGLYDESDERIKPKAWAGHNDGYLDQIIILAGEDVHGKGPTGTTFRERKINFCNDIANDPIMLPWKAEALKRGYKSLVAVPFLRKGKILGTLTLYATEMNFFSEDELNLLLEIGDDISFAINAIDTENLRNKTEKALEQSRNELKTIYDHAPVMMCVVDKNRKILFANQAFSILTGISQAEIIGKAVGGVVGCINSLTEPRGCGFGPKCGNCSLRIAMEKTFNTGVGLRNIEYQSTLNISGLNHEVSLLGSTAIISNDDTSSLLLCLHDITDRMLAEDALQKSEMLLRTFIDNSPFEIWARDMNNVGILENKKSVDHYGSIIGQTPNEVINLKKEITQLWDLQNLRVLNGEIVDEEHEYIFNNKLHVSQQIVFPINNNDKTIGIAGFNIDITERKQAEEALFQNNSRLELAMQVANMAWWEMDIETGKVLFGKRKTDMLGYNSEDFNYFKDFMDLIHPDDQGLALTAMRNHLYGHEDKYEAEYRILASSGKYNWLYDLGNVSKRDALGKPMTISGLVLDITERKTAEKELYDQKQFFEQMFMQSSLSTQILDREGWCERINPKLSQIFGVDAKNLEGKVYNIFKDKEIQLTGVSKNLETVFKKGKTAEWEVFFDIGEAAISQNVIVNENKKVWFYNWAYPIFDQNNEISHVIIQHNDITDRKMAEEALSLSQDQLKKFAAHLQNVREEERVLLAREIHDELGQILIAIKIDMGMLKQNVLKGLKKEHSEQVLSKFDILFGLVDNTIKTARKIMTDLRPEVLDLLGFVETIKQHLNSFQERYKITCFFENTITSLELDSQQSVALFRIIQEALNNVAKHSKASELRVKLVLINDKLSLVIVDIGIGFDENYKKHSDSYGLIGMKERVFLLDGELTISGKKNLGTSITVVMPYFVKKMNNEWNKGLNGNF